MSKMRAVQVARSNGPLMPLARTSLDGVAASASEWAGTADTADTAILAVGEISLPAKQLPR
jgi:hypothetical protein